MNIVKIPPEKLDIDRLHAVWEGKYDATTRRCGRTTLTCLQLIQTCEVVNDKVIYFFVSYAVDIPLVIKYLHDIKFKFYDGYDISFPSKGNKFTIGITTDSGTTNRVEFLTGDEYESRGLRFEIEPICNYRPIETHRDGKRMDWKNMNQQKFNSYVTTKQF